MNKERYSTWWLYLDIDGQNKKLEVDVKEADEEILAAYEEVDNVRCMSLHNLSRYLVHHGAKRDGDYRFKDLKAFESAGVDLSEDDTSMFLQPHLKRRFRTGSSNSIGFSSCGSFSSQCSFGFSDFGLNSCDSAFSSQCSFDSNE
jgi:hypothetical protein